MAKVTKKILIREEIRFESKVDRLARKEVNDGTAT